MVTVRAGVIRAEGLAVRTVVRAADRLIGPRSRRRRLSPYVLLAAEAAEAGVDHAAALSTAGRLLGPGGRTRRLAALQRLARRAAPEGGGTETDTRAGLLVERYGLAPRRILVVGCGDGLEAGLLARRFRADTVEIDIGAEFALDHRGSAPARLVAMDARALDFPDGTFDLVYSFHALEHIGHPEEALAEIRRVLAPGGVFALGTPNKRRLVGRWGSAAPLGDRVRWNLADLRARAAGRWSHEAGAHAGFTRDELRALCAAHLGVADDLTTGYYERRYPGHRRVIAALCRLHVAERLFPCVYVAGRSGRGSPR
jgi:SAM-dependent methyltransferase